MYTVHRIIIPIPFVLYAVANDSRPRYTGRPDYLGLRQDEGGKVEDGNGERFRSETEVDGTKSVARTAVHLWMSLIMRQILLAGSIR